MALPKRLIKALREGTYQPTKASAKARQVARQRRVIPPEPPEKPKVTFYSVKRRIKAKKHEVYREFINYSPRTASRVVDNSDAYDEMVEALDFTNDEMDYYASQASNAWRALNTTGSAGDLARYLEYDFLWYH